MFRLFSLTSDQRRFFALLDWSIRLDYSAASAVREWRSKFPHVDRRC
jgi:hypothetical protein